MKESLIEIIRIAGNFIADFNKKDFSITSKDDINNIVTEVDQASEKLIKEYITKHYPEHGFIGEEYGSENANSDYQWIIDPIDGTINYAHRIPLYCVSIAIAYKNEVIMGAIFNPITNELFFAEKNKGAFLNEKRIYVSENKDFNTAYLVTGFPYHFPKDINIVNIFAQLVSKKLPIRRLGSAALDLAYVAAGRFDGFWEFNLNSWDIAVGYLLVEEAGGKVTDLNNNKGHFNDKQTLATNGLIHSTLLKEINLYK